MSKRAILVLAELLADAREDQEDHETLVREYDSIMAWARDWRAHLDEAEPFGSVPPIPSPLLYLHNWINSVYNHSKRLGVRKPATPDGVLDTLHSTAAELAAAKLELVDLEQRNSKNLQDASAEITALQQENSRLSDLVEKGRKNLHAAAVEIDGWKQQLAKEQEKVHLAQQNLAMCQTDNRLKDTQLAKRDKQNADQREWLERKDKVIDEHCKEIEVLEGERDSLVLKVERLVAQMPDSKQPANQDELSYAPGEEVVAGLPVRIQPIRSDLG